MSEIDSWLGRQAERVRLEVQSAWSKETICPGYTFDPNNLPLGQCGITRDIFCYRMTRLSRVAMSLADILAETEKKGAFATLRNGERVDIITDYLLGQNNERLEYFNAYNRWLSKRVMMCEFGYAVVQATGRKLKDHCWVRAVVRGQEAEIAGTIIDSTLDQFNTEDSQLPAIVVQPADANGSVVTYHAELSEVFGKHDTLSQRTGERVNLLAATKYPLWDQSLFGELGSTGKLSVEIFEQ